MRRDTEAEEREIRELLSRAGPRPAVPPEHLATIRAAAEAEWSRATPVPARRVSPGWALAAASLAVAVAAAWWLFAPLGSGSAAAVASVVRLSGEVELMLPSGAAAAPAVGRELPAGAELATAAAEPGPALAALRWSDGQSVRLAPGSRIRLISARRLELLAGAVYLDSGERGLEAPPVASIAPIAVDTPLGTVTEIGTRFAVRLASADGLLRVRVRHGRVRLERDGEAHLAGAGEELTLDREGTLWRGSVELFGDEWAWVERAAPGFALEGASLSAYLDWVSSETGLRVVFADAALEERALAIEVHGTLGGLGPRQSLDAVLPGSGLAYQVAAGELRLSRADG